MSGAARDLIGGYLAELCAGLRVPADEAELVVAEAEDHLRETAAAGLAAGMTELEAQQAAISCFGPVRVVARAHRRRPVTAGEAATAAWKLTGLLAATAGAGGLAGVGIFTFLLRSALSGPWPGPRAVPASVPAGPVVCPASCFRVAPAVPDRVLTPLVVYAAMAAGGLALLAARRLARRGARGRDLLSPGVTASCFLLASVLLVALTGTGVAVPVAPVAVSWLTSLSEGSVLSAPLVPGAIVAGCLAVAAGYGARAALRRARRGRGSGAFALPRSGSG